MSQTKAVIDFSDYTGADLAAKARYIHERMVQHADIFPDPPISLAELGALVEDYAEKLAARRSRASADVLALKVARADLERALRVLGQFVNTVAGGRAALVEQSGFPLLLDRAGAGFLAPAAPADLRLRHLTKPGEVLARYRPARRHGANEVQVATGDPSEESAWETWGYFPGGRAELTGLPSGALIWVRVRSVGLKGVMGAWCDPAQIRVL